MNLFTKQKQIHRLKKTELMVTWREVIINNLMNEAFLYFFSALNHNAILVYSKA